ncbi:MAG: acyl-CoA dehydrogenase family protein [Gammaproteobacteria bacterium]|nr:acyl-CoA dehydrogenase family protein [Gammaproteobacteria bacterium]MBQ0775509.1 acyl-CoA dehydrogenase family protein [Gammaproteobacteria bacterium]|tara:strand:+ start:6773 stop:7981 length:1209 start_codon:yes stop_codon:yes gene_type:complete
MDFSHSAKAADYIARAERFMKEEIEPHEEAYHRELQSLDDRWVVLPIIEELKTKAREAGLWNLFLPDQQLGAGLSVTDYASIAEITGRSAIAPEIFNCNAPDTGNMEVLYHYGNDAQKAQWLTPLLAGKIRSAFCMTEPGVASSDATNMEATAILDGDDVVLNGRKWWTTGIGHPNCEVIIFMGLTDPTANRHAQHSMVLVPKNSPGVTVPRMLQTMGMYDEPYGHGEVHFDNVRLPQSAIIAGPGRGFEIAQGRLGPGRIHHCMRLIGLAELALKLACERATQRVAFGKPLINLGGNRERIADARMAIEQARLLVLKAAWLIDNKGVFAAMSEISQIKVICPNVAQKVIDMSMQLHGGGGMSNDYPLAAAWTMARALRLADGPDEVHRGLIAKFELMKYKG